MDQPPISAARRAFSLASLVTQGDAVKGSSPRLSLGRPSATSPLEVAIARRSKGAVGGYPLPSQRTVRGRSAHPLAAPTQILMRSSDPGGWPNLTQRVAVEPLAERE